VIVVCGCSGTWKELELRLEFALELELALELEVTRGLVVNGTGGGA